MTGKTNTKKLISALVIICVLVPTVLFSKPNPTNAQLATFDVPTEAETAATTAAASADTAANTSSLGLKIKDAAKEIAESILRAFASKLLNQMTKSTINWINSGFHGNPLYLENPQSFFKDIAKFEVKNLVTLFGYDSVRYPFGKDFSLNVINSYKRQLADNTQYSLSKVINDPVLLNNYRNDFSVGGWNGFLLNTQYPQNNYLGFQMLATEELARKFEGTTQTATQKVQTALQQGMGFLSPQTCPSNPNYNNLKNEFQQPDFKAPKYDPPKVIAPSGPVCDANGECVLPEEDPTYLAQVAAAEKYQKEYEAQYTEEYATWAENNACPEGLVSTTPGSVVASKIFKALGASEDQTGLAAQAKGSVSAVLDSLLNHFIDKGLNALTSRKNQKPQTTDDWNYYGNTLGTVQGYNQGSWDSVPDQEIVLSDFKKTVEDGIKNTTLELQLMYNEDPNNPGISQMFGNIWPKTRELDLCVPGPDINWQDRMAEEVVKNSKQIESAAAKGDEEDNMEVKADLALRELKFAVNFFKDWINNKMMTALPDSVIYMDAVDEIKDLSQQSDELTNRKRARTQALARLKSIKESLDTLTVQPSPDSSQEKTLISLKKQYDATSGSASNPVNIEDSKNELAVTKEKYNNLKKLIIQCTTERTQRGWSNPGGWNSMFNGSSSGGKTIINPADEPASLYNQVVAERAKYGAIPTEADMGRMLSAIAKNNSSEGWGLLKKSGGQHQCPSDFGPVGCDILFNAKSCFTYDVFLGNPELTPQWNFDTHYDRSNWVGNGNWATVTNPPCAPYTIVGGSSGGGAPACTAQGQAEQDFMLPLLNGGTSPQSVRDQTNQKFNLTTGNEAVYYPDSNTIGLPEFYVSGPTTGRPVSPSTGKPWDVTIRCGGSGGGGPSGTEQELFCDRPIVGGYPHEMFQRPNGNGSFNGQTSPNGEYKNLPLVNASNVLTWDKWAWGTGDASASINISCNIIFKANILDYKENLPGLTSISEQKEDWTTDPGGGGGGGGGNFLTCADVPTAKACMAPNHIDLVNRVKSFLASRNISTSGLCGAFEITKRVAWALRDEGAGVLKTFHSGQCNGLAAGNISYTDNSGVDILGDEGGANTSSWNPGPPSTESGVFYVPPSDPGDPSGSY